MKKDSGSTKQTIIDAAVQLIREHGDTAKVTVRDICSRANVGAGLINYHFQTKEKLIDLSVQRIIGGVIGGFDNLEQSLALGPLEKLRYLIKLNFKFLVENPGISRVSILSDLTGGTGADNSAQVHAAYFRLLRKLYGAEKSDGEISAIARMLIATVQVCFLRMRAIREGEGLDLSDEAARNAFLDRVIDRIFYDLADGPAKGAEKP